MKITLKNDYHNTSVTLITKDNILSETQVKRAKRVLCGIHDCYCSGELGTRGEQEVTITETTKGFCIEPLS